MQCSVCQTSLPVRSPYFVKRRNIIQASPTHIFSVHRSGILRCVQCKCPLLPHHFWRTLNWYLGDLRDMSYLFQRLSVIGSFGVIPLRMIVITPQFFNIGYSNYALKWWCWVHLIQPDQSKSSMRIGHIGLLEPKQETAHVLLNIMTIAHKHTCAEIHEVQWRQCLTCRHIGGIPTVNKKFKYRNLKIVPRLFTDSVFRLAKLAVCTHMQLCSTLLCCNKYTSNMAALSVVRKQNDVSPHV